MPRHESQRCATCRFWESECNYCRCHAPTTDRFPKTCAYEWCGEWASDTEEAQPSTDGDVEKSQPRFGRLLAEADRLRDLVDWIISSVYPSEDKTGLSRLTIKHSIGPHAWIEYVKKRMEMAVQPNSET